MPELTVTDEELLYEVEEKLSGEKDEAAAKLVTAWTWLERVVGTRERLERVADHIGEHWRSGAAEEGGKALVVAMSQRIAAELTGLLKATFRSNRPTQPQAPNQRSRCSVSKAALSSACAALGPVTLTTGSGSVSHWPSTSAAEPGPSSIEQKPLPSNGAGGSSPRNSAAIARATRVPCSSAITPAFGNGVASFKEPNRPGGRTLRK